MRKLLILTVLAFLAFYLFTNPVGAAGAVRGGAALLGQAAGAIITFLTTVFA